MFGHDGSTIFDPAAGVFAVPLWLAIALGAAFFVLVVRAIGRAGGQATFQVLPYYALVTVAVLALWGYFERSNIRDRADIRRGLEARATTIAARALVPGSAFSCLDAIAGESIELACEEALFASPQSLAAAISYAGARLALVRDASDFIRNTDSSTLGELRRAVEADRFGFVAHIFATRDRCTADRCDAARILKDARQVTSHLRQGTFGQFLARHQPGWSAKPVSPEPEDAVAASQAAAGDKATSASAAQSNWNYPTSASIPPVSIMNPEPSGPPPQVSLENPTPPPPARKPPPAAPARRASPVPTPPAPPASASTAPPSAVQ